MACDPRVDAFVPLVHQMVIGLVQVYLGYVGVSEGATQMIARRNFDRRNGDAGAAAVGLSLCYH